MANRGRKRNSEPQKAPADGGPTDQARALVVAAEQEVQRAVEALQRVGAALSSLEKLVIGSEADLLRKAEEIKREVVDSLRRSFGMADHE
jgi:alkylhydroperoxidase family enzyme